MALDVLITGCYKPLCSKHFSLSLMLGFAYILCIKLLAHLLISSKLGKEIICASISCIFNSHSQVEESRRHTLACVRQFQAHSTHCWRAEGCKRRRKKKRLCLLMGKASRSKMRFCGFCCLLSDSWVVGLQISLFWTLVIALLTSQNKRWRALVFFLRLV